MRPVGDSAVRAEEPVQLPTGNVTFLFTDIEGSTRMWEADRGTMARVLARHDSLSSPLIPLRREASN